MRTSAKTSLMARRRDNLSPAPASSQSRHQTRSQLDRRDGGSLCLDDFSRADNARAVGARSLTDLRQRGSLRFRFAAVGRTLAEERLATWSFYAMSRGSLPCSLASCSSSRLTLWCSNSHPLMLMACSNSHRTVHNRDQADPLFLARASSIFLARASSIAVCFARLLDVIRHLT
jgi:hypothetical protein